MNTERPENDDAARKPEKPEKTSSAEAEAQAEDAARAQDAEQARPREAGRPEAEPATAEVDKTGSEKAEPAASDEVATSDEVAAASGVRREADGAAVTYETDEVGDSAVADRPDGVGAVKEAAAPGEPGAFDEPGALRRTPASRETDAARELGASQAADAPQEAADSDGPGDSPDAGGSLEAGGSERAGVGGEGAVSDGPVAADAGRGDAGGDGGAEPVVGAVGGGERVPGPRRRSPLLIASVAAAVLLVGGGGAYLTAGASGGSGGGSGSGSPSGDGSPTALALDDHTAGTGASQGSANGIAPGEPNPYGVTYHAAGTLPDGPGSAPVYWAKGEVAADEAARLAKALGVDGTPVADGQAWRIGAGDSSGPALRVNRQAPGMWTFTRYAPGTDNCTALSDTCAQSPAPAPATDEPVSEAAAKKAAAPILKALGQDDAKVDASLTMGAQRMVNADPVVGGLPTYSWTTGISVNAQGEVVAGNGQLEAPAKGDTYPLVSAQEALDALNAAPGTGHRMGIGGCASPVPLKDRLESPCGTSPSTPKQRTATVEDAVLGLAPHTSGGRQVLVPSWLFAVKAAGGADGYTVAQPAVEPAYLKSATTPTPTPRPTGSSGTRDVRVDGYSAEGRELTVGFTGGVCADYKATATETKDEVKVTVTQTPWPDKVCIMIAKEYHQVVRLDEPLGARKVVGSDGAGVPLEKPGARLPQTR
ncbi:hypothetical protein QFZ66_006296 [Streptomyces sp. B4I13]|uniref:hypothetical protein n=1 Tax=Streptomyces sp. B4I13 TaxID=3042271 RepID=UPI002782D442|nr:hypothetical protein [Streptomyces sp. B4I13]MDQ0962418.1 hypothetical protein [Streptomyces sp. B4I13]